MDDGTENGSAASSTPVKVPGSSVPSSESLLCSTSVRFFFEVCGSACASLYTVYLKVIELAEAEADDAAFEKVLRKRVARCMLRSSQGKFGKIQTLLNFILVEHQEAHTAIFWFLVLSPIALLRLSKGRKLSFPCRTLLTFYILSTYRG